MIQSLKRRLLTHYHTYGLITAHTIENSTVNELIITTLYELVYNSEYIYLQSSSDILIIMRPPLTVYQCL